MNESFHLFELVLLLGLAAGGLAIFERFRLPAVVGFLVVGALAGPGALGLIDDPERVRVLAELGVVFLLFEIGLELPMERLRDLGREALRVGGPQVVGTAAITALAGTWLGLAWPAALILGAAVAMSSTALVMKLLTDEGQVVGHEEVGHAVPALELDEQIDDLRSHRHVEGRHRLVADDEVRPQRQGVIHGHRSFLPVMIEQGVPAHVVNTAPRAGS